jgi:putative transposase
MQAASSVTPRVHAELRALGTRCGRKRVERLMLEAGLRGCVRGRRRGTTRRGKRSAAEDLLKRNFVATQPDRIWVADITYIATREGFVYLAFILDVYSRRIVGCDDIASAESANGVYTEERLGKAFR